MALEAFLPELLPPLFDSAVERLTGKRLLLVEREAILTALVNSIGESVMRRARLAATKTDGFQTISKITTTNRFDDKWMGRSEVLEGMEHSSGLSRALSDFALFLIEFRLDSALIEDTVMILGLGRVEADRRAAERSHRNVLEQSKRSFGVANQFDRPSLDQRLEFGERSLGWLASLPILFRHRDISYVKHFLEVSHYIMADREPLPYTINLSDSLAFKNEDLKEKIIEIPRTKENSVNVKPSSNSPRSAT